VSNKLISIFSSFDLKKRIFWFWTKVL